MIEIDRQAKDPPEERTKHECCTVMPSKEFLMNLSILTDLTCPVVNCGGVFSNTSALNFHLEKSHRLCQKRDINSLMVTTAKTQRQKEIESCDCKYYCPEPKCKYNFRDGQKCLPSFYSLKNHFIRMHGAKSFACNKCCKLFSIKSELHRHQEKCGLLFKCSCGCFYSTKNALVKHQRSKGHHDQEEAGTVEKTIVKLNASAPGPKHLSRNNIRLLSSSIKIKNFEALPPKDAVKNSSAGPVLVAQPPSHFQSPCEVEENRSKSCQTSGMHAAQGFTSETACQTTDSSHGQPYQFHYIYPGMGPKSHKDQFSSSQDEASFGGSRAYVSSSQETQTVNSTNRSSSTTMLTDDYYLDAATSTSPFDPFGESLWNEISTQTNLSSFQVTLPNSCSATNTDDLLFSAYAASSAPPNKPKPSATAGVVRAYEDQSTSREIQTCPMPAIDTCTQTGPAKMTATIGVGDNFTGCDSGPNAVLGHSTFYENYGSAMNNAAENYYHRCLTPPVSISSASTQTQNGWAYLQNGHNNFVDMITQTEWNFEF